MLMKTFVLFFACCVSLSVHAGQLQSKLAGKVDDALGRAGMAAVVLEKRSFMLTFLWQTISDRQGT